MKIGIVGTGGVAVDNYLPVLAAIDDVELLYYNRTAAKAEAAAATFGGTVCASLEALVGAQPETVFVLTRETQRQAAIEALLACRPQRLMLEKPLVARHGQANVCEEDFATGAELLRQAAAVGTETAMIFNYRFLDHTMAARDVLASRDFGKVFTVCAHVHYACWSHVIDLIHYFAGPVAEVTALSGTIEHALWQTQAKDIAAAFRTAGDASGTILGSQSMSFQFPLFDLDLTFERGRISFRGLDDVMEIQDYAAGRQELHRVPMNFSRWDQYRATFRKAVTAYIDSVRHGQAPPVPGIAGLRELQFEAGLRRAAATGRAVLLADAFPINIEEE